MLLYRIDCLECGSPRVGRKPDDTIEPLRDDCPLCGSERHVAPAEEND